MKTTALSSLILLFTSVLAAPSPLVSRQLPGDTSNDLIDGPCLPIIFIFARGTFETGNMGVLVGPETCDGLKKRFGAGNVACQGVGGAYTANVVGNFVPTGTDPASVAEGTKLFDLANSKCPNSVVVSAGYSQGAALISDAVGHLEDQVKDQVKGVVLYGYTQNLQDDGSIPGYPLQRTKVFCMVGDAICDGTLIVTLSHLTYAEDVPEAVAFFAEQIGS